MGRGLREPSLTPHLGLAVLREPGGSVSPGESGGNPTALCCEGRMK